MNLYEKDYTHCSEELLKLASQIKEKNTNGRMIDSKYYYELPKEVRHYQSMFPNNFLDTADLHDEQSLEKMRKIEQELKELINDTSKTELDLKRFIQNKRAYFIIGSLLKRNYNFGHHGAYVFPEFRLGNDYVCDYLIVGDSSDGFKFVFVEMESINYSPKIRDDRFSDSLRKGINQIKDWQIWLEKNFNTLDFRKYKSPIKELPEEFIKYISTRLNFLIVCGKRANFSNKFRDLCRKEQKESNILILNHDNLLDSVDELLNSEFTAY